MSARAVERAVAEAQTLGALKAGFSIGRSLSLGAFLNFRKFVDDASYEALGYTTAVEFLNSGDSPMTKSQYYERLSALAREGEPVFDLLNSMQITLKNRKLLNKGEIRIEGDDVIVGQEESEERVPIGDRLAVKTLIATLVEEKTKSQIKIQSQDQQLKKQEKQLKKGQEDFEKLKRKAGQASDTPHLQALLLVRGAYVKLRDEIVAYRQALGSSTAAEEEFAGFQKTVVDALGAAYVELMPAFDIEVPDETALEGSL